MGDAAQRERALASDQSFIVQAPAGSGKTGLLVQRILSLLGQIERPESIVAVTFTIKAAAEMRDRVVQALQDAEGPEIVGNAFAARTRQLACVVLARDKALGWGLAEDASALRIQTIDAFCASLVRQMPIVSQSGGVGPVTEEAGDLYREAARNAIESLSRMDEGTALFRRVALHFDGDLQAVEQQIANMLARRDAWHSITGANDTVNDFALLLEQAEEELRDVFRRHDTVDFIEITSAARTGLGGAETPTDLLYALDYRIEHVLVDEFQDTSRSQYKLLESLTSQWSLGDGRTLFLVGDPLQSIYGFRAAEVALFQQCWQQGSLGAVQLEPLRLSQNFRSTRQIVDWVQGELGPVLNDDDKETGAVPMVRATAARSEAGPVPSVIATLNDKSGEQQADKVVEIVRAQKQLAGTAILVRNRTKLGPIVRALRQAGIRYQAIDIDPLGEQQHILDLLSLMRAVTHLADRTAWLACLRAPWCGLTLEDLAALAEGEASRTILDLLLDPAVMRRLTIDGRFRAAAFASIMQGAAQRAGTEPLRRLLEEVWYQLGGPAVLLQSNQREDAQVFFSLIEALDRGGTIRDPGELKARLQRLYARPDNSNDSIQVMTIHQAKGLEFDTVILPGLHDLPRQFEGGMLAWNETAEGQIEIAARPQRGVEDADYNRICGISKQKERNEAKRLFYVACTRARNALVLLGSAEANKNGKDCRKVNVLSFLGMIWDAHKSDFNQLLRVPKAARQTMLFDTAAASRTIARLPRDWKAPVFAASIEEQPLFERATASVQQPAYRWAQGSSRQVGSLVHGVLHRIATDGLAQWDSRRIDAFASSAEAEFRRIGAVDPKGARQQTVRALHNIVNSPRGQWILGDRESAHSEWPIAGVLNREGKDRLISGTIDRMFRDHGRLWIIDYKTSDHEGGKLEEFLTREKRRYLPQMETYAALLSQREQIPVSLGLYFPMLDAWREWEFEAITIAAR